MDSSLDLVAEWEKTEKPKQNYKYADMNRENDTVTFRSEEATTVFRWLDPCDPSRRTVLQQKFIVRTRKNASDQPLKTIEWRTIPLVEG